MSAPTNHWKLGLFVVVGFVASVTSVIVFGARTLQKESVAYTTYFDESVQGLELGSPVKFRGVSIGNVSTINVAKDKRHVEVVYELGVNELQSLGLTVGQAHGQATKMVIPSDLRAQLAATGITGVKFILMDFFDEKTYPSQPLPFEVPENNIPAAASVIKGLEDSVVNAVDSFPELAQQLLAVLTRISGLLGSIEDIGLPKKIKETLVAVDAVLKQMNSILGLASTTLSDVNNPEGRQGGSKSLPASLRRTSEALGTMAANATHVGPALEDALKDVQEAAQSVHRLADALEREPDMLLKGRGRKTK